MPRATAAAAVVVLLMLAPRLQAQPVNVTGDWAVEFSTSLGTGRTVMTLEQAGTRVVGYMTTERNETPVKGTVEDNRFRVVWEQPVEGEIIQVTFEAVVKGATMTGTVRFGTLADGPFYAERR